MIASIYETYGLTPFIIVFLILVVLMQQFRIKDLSKNSERYQKMYFDSEASRKEERENKERADKEVQKLFNDKRSEYLTKIDNERNDSIRRIKKISDSHSRELSLMSEHHSAEIASLNEQHQTEITNLNHRMEEYRDEKSKEITQLSRAYASDVKEYKDQINDLQQLLKEKENKIIEDARKLEERNAVFKRIMSNNLDAMPFLAGMMSDYLTYDLEVLANQLHWGDNIQRKEKEVKIRAIRREAQQRIEEAKQAEYQLAYLIELYPELEEIIETDYREVCEKPTVDQLLSKTNDTSEFDSTRQYLSKEEWKSLTPVERNQLALDRYVEGRSKSKWQIGRDYELYVGYSKYECQGWHVQYFGSEKKLEDLGRDLIATRGIVVEIVQCKYWAKEKIIHEKHIFQLYGTKVCYEMEHENESIIVKAKFITNIELSATAKEVAEKLGIEVEENYDIGSFPRIKCNIGKDADGKPTKIYHLPMDQQYDNVIIDKEKGEMIVTTVNEAEKAGFRRAFKWFA